MMPRKIISGGQTGADRAALDVAIKLDIPHGGWIPKGRLTEDGVLSKKYRLTEIPTANYPKRAEKNVTDSDGTAIFSTSDSSFEISFGCQAGPTSGDGGSWHVEFDDHGHVVLAGGACGFSSAVHINCFSCFRLYPTIRSGSVVLCNAWAVF